METWIVERLTLSLIYLLVSGRLGGRWGSAYSVCVLAGFLVLLHFVSKLEKCQEFYFFKIMDQVSFLDV